MGTLEFEYHAALRGDGFVWRPALSGPALSEGPAGIDEAGATRIATAMMDSPPDTTLRVWDSQGRQWVFLALGSSGFRGVRGSAVQLAESGPESALPPTDVDFDLSLQAALVTALRSARHAMLPLSAPLCSLLVGGDPAATALLALAGSSKPALFVADLPPDLKEKLAQRAGAVLLGVRDPDLVADEPALSVVAWARNPDSAPEWESLRAWLRPRGDEPIQRLLSGAWSERSSALLAELSSAPWPVIGTDEVASRMERIREAPAALGCEPVAIETALFAEATPRLRLAGAALILEVPRRAPEVKQLRGFKRLLEDASAGALSGQLDEEFRRAAVDAPPGSAAWWFGKGVAANLLPESRDELVPPAESVRLVDAVSRRARFDDGERRFLVDHLRRGAQGALGSRSTVWGEPLERVAAMLESPALRMLSALHRRMIERATHPAPTLEIAVTPLVGQCTTSARWRWESRDADSFWSVRPDRDGGAE